MDSTAHFTVGKDAIHIDHNVFSALAATGALSSAAFLAGAKALTADQHVLYSNSALYYDADGAGGVAAVQFAYIGNKAALTEADFIVV